jgi:hypothetical protein
MKQRKRRGKGRRCVAELETGGERREQGASGKTNRATGKRSSRSNQGPSPSNQEKEGRNQKKGGAESRRTKAARKREKQPKHEKWKIRGHIDEKQHKKEEEKLVTFDRKRKLEENPNEWYGREEKRIRTPRAIR